MNLLVQVGSLIFTAVSCRCGGCGREAMMFVNYNGKTVCVSCAPQVKR